MKERKNILTYAALSVLTLAGAAVAVAAQSPIGTKAEKSTNIYPSVGFENILAAGEDSYDFALGLRSGVGQAADGASIKALRETVGESSNTYLQMSNSGGAGSFANTFALFPTKLTTARKYSLSFDFRKEAGFTTTDNVGFRFWTDPATLKDGEKLASKINEAENGKWFTVTSTYELNAAQAAVGADSFQLWFNTKDGTTLNVLDVDNVKITAIVPEASVPSVTPGVATWHPDTPADIVFTVDLKGFALSSVTDEGGTALTVDQCSLSGTSLTFKSAYLASIDSGAHIFTIATEKGTVQVVITTIAAKGTIPTSTDGYTLTPTMLGGTFESYEIGTKFSEAQTPEAWGSLSSYDDPGEIVNDGTGNHVLQLKRAVGSGKMYSSAFCMTSTDIAKNDIVTLKFDYKMNTTDAANVLGKGINVCFVGGSNTAYHQIALDGSKPSATGEGNSDEYTYSIAYTELATGYTHVEMSYIVDFAFLNSTNSLRFLMQILNDNDSLFIDNVELVRWVAATADETPTITPATAAFDNKASADVAFTVDLKSYNISSIKLDGATVSSHNYALDGTTLSVKKEYLATLENGDHVFTLNTLGGSVNFTITVSNHGTAPVDNPPSSGMPAWGIALIVIGGVLVLAGAGGLTYYFIKKRKAK